MLPVDLKSMLGPGEKIEVERSGGKKQTEIHRGELR